MSDGDSLVKTNLESSDLPRSVSETAPVCSICHEVLLADLEENHLRSAHHLYSYRGIRRSVNETLAAILEALSSLAPDRESWTILEALARNEQGAKATAFLATVLVSMLRRIPGGRRIQALAALADTIAGSETALQLLPHLATRNPITAHRLALGLLIRLAARLPRNEVREFFPLLSNRRLGGREVILAAGALLEQLGKDENDVAVLCEILVAGRRRRRALARLDALEHRIGKSPALQNVRTRLEDQAHMRCPRCGLKGSRRDMTAHLWQEHRLLLDGQKVRKPWPLIEEWIADHGKEANPTILDRCRALADQLDPVHGSLRIARLLVSHGIEDGAARQVLFGKAVQLHATVCPKCCALMPQPLPGVAPQLILSHGRLATLDYRVEINEKGWTPHLEIVVPKGIIFQGREPIEGLTARGAQAIVLALVALALAFASGLIPLGLPAFLPVLVLLAFAVGLVYKNSSRRRGRPPLAKRTLHFAWTRLVPTLHSQGFQEADAGFLSGLSLATVADGRFAVSEDMLFKGLRDTEIAVSEGKAATIHLAALRRLDLARQMAEGKDPVALLVGQVARCFERYLPMAFGEELLQGWNGAWRTKPNLARLRIQLCDQAFEAGYEVATLREALHDHPVLADILGSKDSNGLAHLRLLWSLRPGRPWDRLGHAVTAYEAASSPEEARLFARNPDLLLIAEAVYAEPEFSSKRPPPPDQILLCSRGVVFRDILLSEIPEHLEVHREWKTVRESFELFIGRHSVRFAHDPQPIVNQLERWCRYYFQEFQPEVEKTLAWKTADARPEMHARGAVCCPDCLTWLLPRPGEKGLVIQAAGQEHA